MLTIERQLCNDCEELTETIRGSDLQSTQVSKGRFRGDLVSSKIADGFVDAGFYNCALYATGILPEDATHAVIFLGAEGEALLNGYKGFVSGDLALLEGGVELIYALAPETSWVSFQLKRKDLKNLGVDFGRPENKVYKKAHLADFSFMAALNSLANLFRKKEVNQIANVRPGLLYNHLAETLAYLLTNRPTPVTLGHGDYLHCATTLQGLLNDNIEDILQVSDLCRITGKSERTLERVCARAFASSPRLLLKKHRLGTVRKALLDADGRSSSVTELAFAYGFMHPGRFAGEYKKFFGELPSQTLSQTAS